MAVIMAIGQKNFFEVNSHFGSAEDLKALASAVHRRGMYLMVDVVANHVGIVNDFSEIYPFNSDSDYHPDCQVNNYVCFTDEIYRCRLANLPDLDQSNSWVNATLLHWINQLVKNYSIDGFRIDTVPYIDQTFWAHFQQAAGVYTVGEVEMDINCCAAYQKTSLNGVLSYPMYWTLNDVFQNGHSMNELQDQWSQYNKFPNKDWLGSFIENHDHPRFLNNNQNKVNQYKNALIHVLYGSGIPIIYYGTEQLFHGGNDPGCREPLWTARWDTSTDMYRFLSQAIAFRKKVQVWNYPQVQRYSTDGFYAFTRGKTFVALTNQESYISEPITYHDYSDGTKLCDLFNPGDCVVVKNKQFTVALPNGLPKILYPQ
jgi:alpha-amylase